MNLAINYRSIGIPFLFLCLYNGIFVALLKLVGVDFPTSPINLTAILFLPLLLISLRSSRLKKLKVILGLVLVLILFKALVVLFSTGLTLTDVMQFILYDTCILSIYFFASMPKEKALKSLRYLRHSFVIFGTLYFVQYFFYPILPPALTEIPNLFMEIGVERYTRELEYATIYRPNALIGNPITLGFYLNLIFSIELFYWNKKQSKASFFKLLLIALMIGLLFSRANIGLLFSLCFFNFILQRNISENFIFIPAFVLILAITAYSLYGSNFVITFTLDRLIGHDSHAVASYLEHISDYIAAINTFLSNPLVGISPEQVLKQEIITDGALFILLLHFGSLGFLSFSIGYLKLIKAIKYLYNSAKQFAPQLIFFIVLIPYSLLNSAVLNKGLFLVAGIYIGIILNLYYSRKKKSYLVYN